MDRFYSQDSIASKLLERLDAFLFSQIQIFRSKLCNKKHLLPPFLSSKNKTSTMTRIVPGRQLFGLLLLCLSVYKADGSKQIDREAVEPLHHRKLQTNFTLYNYNTTATYAFDFDLVIAPNTPPTATQVQELLRRTGIYLTRSTSSVFPSAFQGLQLVYHSLQWEAVDDIKNHLIVNFETRVSFRSGDEYGQKLAVPDTEEVLDAIVKIDQEFFLTNFVRSVDPQEVFQK